MIAAVAIGSLGLLLALGQPAHAAITQGSCDASVAVGGKTYGAGNDTPANPIPIPAGRPVPVGWKASSAHPIHDYTGTVSVELGPFSLVVARWSGTNAAGSRNAQGTYTVFANLAPNFSGLYRVQVDVQGTDGGCSGFAFVKVTGSPLRTPPARIAVTLTSFALAFVVFAALPRRRRG